MKIKKKNIRSNAENHLLATLDQEKVKTKEISNGENLLEASGDGRFDTLPEHYQERSSILIEPTEAVNIGTTEQPKILHPTTSLSEVEMQQYVEFFKRRQINFAWSYADTPRLDPELIMHHLNVNPGAKPVKHKLRKMHLHIALLVKAELLKLLDVGFIRPIAYPQWVSNIVPVSKPDKSIRICTDFRDLNNACPKDDFPLPNIDIIVDLTEGHSMFSLMDGFSRYNQIKIAPKDQEKTAFTCPWGTFC